MIERIYRIKNKTINIMFDNAPYYADENTIIMGFPYNIDNCEINENNIDTIKGYYTYIKFNNDCLTLINDIFGNYRTYYMEKDNDIYISNNFMYLFNLLTDDERIPNKIEIEYWNKHRYTTGGKTVCEKIYKIEPSHIYKFTKNGIEKKLYFKDIKNVPNRKNLFHEILDDMRSTVSTIKKLPQKKFLLFSGGADSTLCVHLLKEQNVDFTPVFAKHIPGNSMNAEDINKVYLSAKKLGISPVEIEIDTTKQIDNDIIDIMFQDRSITQLFFDVAKKLKEMYGENIILINGQCADSIFGFGATDKNFVNFIARNFMFNSNNFLFNQILLLILRFAKKDYYKYRLPKNNREFMYSFFDDKVYKPLIDLTKNKEYVGYLNKIITNFEFDNTESLMMYLKIYGFIQGSDNFVNVQNCEYYGIHSIFLFATQQIVYSVIKNTDYKYEIMHPKSVVYEILKKVYNYEMPVLDKVHKSKSTKTISFKDYETQIYKNFYNKLNSLNFSKRIE